MLSFGIPGKIPLRTCAFLVYTKDSRVYRENLSASLDIAWYMTRKVLTIGSLKLIFSPHSREFAYVFCFASCKTSQNLNISQLLT